MIIYSYIKYKNNRELIPVIIVYSDLIADAVIND